MTIPLDPNDTVAAAASPSGPAARGIVRLSGPRARPIALDTFAPDRDWSNPPRGEMRSGWMRVDGLRPPLPVMVALWPAPATYTGQDVAELHLIGSAPLVELVLAHCFRRGARHAEPGEFTLRAFLSGRIDLVRAEAVLGVIDAESQAELDAALEQLAGGLSAPVLALRDRLLDVVAHLEANLDFQEEPDVEPLARAALADELARSADDLAALARRLDERGRSDGHPRVVLIGPPNAGKSRLFNALLDRDRAIVSPIAGTTRDYLTGLCDCDGLTVELVDTAGAEHGVDFVSEQAQAQRARQTGRADLLLDCRPVDDEADEVGMTEFTMDVPLIPVWTKCDRASPARLEQVDGPRLATSAKTGAGLDELRRAIAERLQDGNGEAGFSVGTAARCRDSVLQAEAALRAAHRSMNLGSGDEFVAFDLRLAIEELGKVVGAVVTDDILDRIFRRFCIGK